MSLALQEPGLYLDSPEWAGDCADAEDLVLIHGWGCDSRIWQSLIPLLEQRFRVHRLDLPGMGANASRNPWRDEELLMEVLAEALPARAHLVGWSLGGNLALAFAARYPERVRSLCLIATNLSFVARPDWPCALPESDFLDFFHLVQADTAAGLKRFQQLQVKGDPAGRGLVRQLRDLTGGVFTGNGNALRDALSWLQSRDQRCLLAQLAMPVAWIFGEHDELVPKAVADRVPSARVMAATGHLPMLTNPSRLAALLEQSLGPRDGTSMDKGRIARSFSRAAASYDSAAELQRAVGMQLTGLMPELQPDKPCLDLGCGTGGFLQQQLGERQAPAWLGGDIAEGMLRHAQSRHALLEGRLIGMDADSLPLADGVLQGIHSNLALQWCQDLDALFRELRRVVAPGGWLVFSTLVSGTLSELKAAWQQVDRHVHVNRFYTEQVWQAAALQAGWQNPRWHSESRPRHYPQLRNLLGELKALGAHNVNAGMPGGLTGKNSWQRLCEAYECNRDRAGNLPASWQVLYGVLSNG